MDLREVLDPRLYSDDIPVRRRNLLPPWRELPGDSEHEHVADPFPTSWEEIRVEPRHGSDPPTNLGEGSSLWRETLLFLHDLPEGCRRIKSVLTNYKWRPGLLAHDEAGPRPSSRRPLVTAPVRTRLGTHRREGRREREQDPQGDGDPPARSGRVGGVRLQPVEPVRVRDVRDAEHRAKRLHLPVCDDRGDRPGGRELAMGIPADPGELHLRRTRVPRPQREPLAQPWGQAHGPVHRGPPTDPPLPGHAPRLRVHAVLVLRPLLARVRLQQRDRTRPPEDGVPGIFHGCAMERGAVRSPPPAERVHAVQRDEPVPWEPQPHRSRGRRGPHRLRVWRERADPRVAVLRTPRSHDLLPDPRVPVLGRGEPGTIPPGRAGLAHIQGASPACPPVPVGQENLIAVLVLGTTL